jgi:hypothetical protein
MWRCQPVQVRTSYWSKPTSPLASSRPASILQRRHPAPTSSADRRCAPAPPAWSVAAPRPASRHACWARRGSAGSGSTSAPRRAPLAPRPPPATPSSTAVAPDCLHLPTALPTPRLARGLRQVPPAALVLPPRRNGSRRPPAHRAAAVSAARCVITALSCDERNVVKPDTEPLCAAFFLAEIRGAFSAIHSRRRSSAT